MHDGDVLRRKEQDTEEHWISISDMMAGLMVIFLFIAISYMLHVRAVADAYFKLQSDLYDELKIEFEEDFKLWKAVLDKDSLSIRFKEPEVLFPQGGIEVTDHFKQILNEFFPRYIKILTKPKYKADIHEIRIEGHTSPEWSPIDTPDEAYIKNMKLSQDRTRSVLDYVLFDEDGPIKHNNWIQTNKEWIKSNLTANGLSSSKPITDDIPGSRRVEFRVRTDAEKRISEILNHGVQE